MLNNKPKKIIYDYVFLTHLPAFYKANLYQEIAKSCKIFVIFIAASSVIRSADFTKSVLSFDYCILNKTAFENRSSFLSVCRLQKWLQTIKYRKIVVGGWDLIEFWWVILLSPKIKNALALESSVFESGANGWRRLIKKFFLSNISTVFCSGKPQARLLQTIGFKGEIKFTLGVGIFNYSFKDFSPLRPSSVKTRPSSFLYVGRLAPEKNIGLLIEIFRTLPHYTLTIIGEGPLKKMLESSATPNIKFTGYIEKETLGMCYRQHDVFILPSFKEPWGLVVEEALFHGLPVLVSEKVGCAYDLVKDQNVGLLFDPSSGSDLYSAIDKMSHQYLLYKNNLEKLNFIERDKLQVQQYLDLLA